MKTVIFILLILGLYFGICVTVGVKWALAAMAIFMIVLATTFIMKKGFYIKYIQFVNPRYALLYNSKDEDFKRKHKNTDIIIFYIISALMLFMSAIMKNLKLSVDNGYLLYLLIGTALFSILLWAISLIILKKSTRNSSFWFCFLAVILLSLLIFAFIF